MLNLNGAEWRGDTTVMAFNPRLIVLPKPVLGWVMAAVAGTMTEAVVAMVVLCAYGGVVMAVVIVMVMAVVVVMLRWCCW